MGTENDCHCAEKHPRHICLLKHKGLIGTIKALTLFPNVVCLNCSAVADSEDNVCSPAPLFV